MNVTDAAYAVAHDYPGGTESLAPRLSMSGALLRNKVNPNNPNNHLTLAEAQRMTDIADDERILHAWCHERNGVFVKLPGDAGQPDNEEIVDRFMRLTVHYGELALHFQKSTADGEVDARELAELERIGNLIHRTVEEIKALTVRIYCRTPASKAD